MKLRRIADQPIAIAHRSRAELLTDRFALLSASVGGQPVPLRWEDVPDAPPAFPPF